jgi:KDO2-lipid IV(A) lauroyltransferase
LNPGQAIGAGALRGLMRCCALLGSRGCWRAAGPLASWLWRGNARRRHATLRNLAIAYPDLDPASREQMSRVSTRHYVCNILEAGMAWYWSESRIAACFDAPVGAGHLEAARAAGKGVIVALPHFGAWELLGLHLREQIDGGILFKPGRNAALDRMLLERRTRFGLSMLPATPSGLRQLLDHLRKGQAVGVLPDQEPSIGEGRFANFFSLAALTGVLVPRLVQSTGARVVFAAGVRRPGGRFQAHYLPAEGAVHGADLDAALVALNRGVEACVALDPPQYLWAYRRWRHRPPGEPRRY